MAESIRIVERCLVLDQPAFDAAVVAEVDPGTTLELLGGDHPDFYRVAYQGRPGFVAKVYATKVAEGSAFAPPAAAQRVRCPWCGREAPAGAAVCPSCGRDLPREGRCPTCGAAILAGDQFCGACGQPLAGRGRPVEAEARQFAGFWQRFGALFLDGIIVGVATFAIALILTAPASGDTTYVPSLVGLVLGAVYYSVGNGLGGTLGKRAFNLRVIKDSDGSVPGLASGFVRWFISEFSALVLLLGYFWMIWDAKKQTWHDKAAGTVVIRID